MVRRTKEEAEKTRDAILDAAEKVFYDKGVSYTSMQDIASCAGVTRGAVYWHFRDKAAILEAMGQRIYLPQEDLLERLLASDSKTPLEDLRHACIDSMKSMVRDFQRRRVFSILMHKCEIIDGMEALVERRLTCKDRVVERFTRFFEKAQRLKLLAPGWSPRVAANTLQWLLVGFLSSETERPIEEVRDRDGVACVNAFFQAVTC